MRVPFIAQLHSIGLSLDDFTAYWDIFVKEQTRYWRKDDPERAWHQIKKKDGGNAPLSKYAVKDHLMGYG